MNFELTEEQQLIRDAARDFAQNEIAPIAAEFDHSGTFPEATIRQAGELGFMGIEVPEQYGGSGLDSICYALVMEEISAADAAHGTIVSVNNSSIRRAVARIRNGGTKERLLKTRRLRDRSTARTRSPSRNRDPTPLRCDREPYAQPDGSYYTINAKKSWITSGPGSQVHHSVCEDRPGRRRFERHKHVRYRHRARGLRNRQDGTKARDSCIRDL